MLVKGVLGLFVYFLVGVIWGKAIFDLGPGGFHFKDLSETFKLEGIKPLPAGFSEMCRIETIEEFGSDDRVINTDFCGVVAVAVFPENFKGLPGEVGLADSLVKFSVDVRFVINLTAEVFCFGFSCDFFSRFEFNAFSFFVGGDGVALVFV